MSFVYKPKVEIKPAGLDGVSEKQISQHWTLYEGYVKNVNLVNEKLTALRQKEDFGPEFSELTRRLGFEYNGMILHEYYFGVMKPGQAAPSESSELSKQIKKTWGSFAAWQKEFSSIGKMRGIGWAILYFDPYNEALTNHWITLHEEGHPAGYQPVLVMDVWEHAYMVDWGATGRPDYVTAFLKNVNWDKVGATLESATRTIKA
jgi:superoxide dismutase, Fe-Mn family